MILAPTYLAQVHFYRGDFERAVELAADSLAACPADWVHEPFGYSPIPISVYCRLWMVHSLAELGRLGETAPYEAELLRLAGPTQHAFTVGEAHNAASWLHLRKGDWATARSVIEHGIAAVRKGNVAAALRTMVAASSWVHAQVGEASEALTRLREGELLLESQSRPIRCRDRGDPLPQGAGTGRAARHAAPHRPLPSWPRQTLPAHRPTRAAHEHLTVATTLYREMDMQFWLDQAETEMKEMA
jgi:hypothetical protein